MASCFCPGDCNSVLYMGELVKILDKIKIGGHWLTIKFPYLFKERVDCFGQYDGSVKEIRIVRVDSGGNVRADSAILVDLIHEIFHAIDRNSGHEMFVGEEGEKRCVAMSEGWFQVLRDNDLDFRDSD